MLVLPDKPDGGEASERVFTKLYRVRAPRSLTLSDWEIEHYGQRVTGFKQLDKYLANEMIVGRISTVEMAKIIERGGCIQFCNIFDAQTCYIDLYQHLFNWEWILKTQYNVDAPPEEDIYTLRELQEALEAYRGLFDADDPRRGKANKFSVLDVRDAGRKQFSKRVAVDPQHKRNLVEVVHIDSYEDLQRITGR